MVVGTLRKLDADFQVRCNSWKISGSFSDSDLSKLPSGVGTRTLSNYQSSTDIKQVTVTVTWQQNNNQKKIDLATLIYRNGI